MNKAYQIEICEMHPSGAAGKTLDTQFADTSDEALQIAKQAKEQGHFAMVSSWSEMNSDYVIDVAIMEDLLGRTLM